MKIKHIVEKSAIMIMIIYICTCTLFTNISYGIEGTKKVATVDGNEELMLPTIGDGYKPTLEEDGKMIDIITSILSILTIVGVITVVLAIAIIGFGSIMGSASEKAINKEKYTGVFVAALIITGGSIIARLIISVADNI